MRSSHVDDGERPRTNWMADDLTLLRFAIADGMPRIWRRVMAWQVTLSAYAARGRRRQAGPLFGCFVSFVMASAPLARSGKRFPCVPCIPWAILVGVFLASTPPSGARARTRAVDQGQAVARCHGAEIEIPRAGHGSLMFAAHQERHRTPWRSSIRILRNAQQPDPVRRPRSAAQ